MVRGLSKALKHAVKDVKKFSRYDEDDARVESPSGPRSFPRDIKEACWRKAPVVKGRDIERWRRDSLGNLVFRPLIGCQGCLCYNYDHVVPYSKGGKSNLDNCQVLQVLILTLLMSDLGSIQISCSSSGTSTAANSAKGSRTAVSSTELMQRSVYCRLSGRDMDMMELSAYGNIHHEDQDGILGCKIQ